HEEGRPPVRATRPGSDLDALDRAALERGVGEGEIAHEPRMPLGQGLQLRAVLEQAPVGARTPARQARSARLTPRRDPALGEAVGERAGAEIRLDQLVSEAKR